MTRFAMRLVQLSILFLLAATGANAHAETALVINNDGLGAQASLGEVVEVGVSKDGLEISIGGENYPKGHVAFNTNGCFSVGISEGLGSIYKDAKFEGTGTYDSIKFTATVEPSVSAEVEICPSLTEALQLVATGGTQNPGSVQPMAVKSVQKNQKRLRWKKNESVELSLDAFCLDISKDEPAPGTILEIVPERRLLDQYEALLQKPSLTHEDLQECIWLALPDTYVSYQLELDSDESVRSLVAEQIRDYEEKCEMTSSQTEQLMRRWQTE